MNDPIRAIKSLPWLAIAQVALLTSVLAVTLDRLLQWLVRNIEPVRLALNVLGQFGPLLLVLVGMAVGCLGLYLAEQLRPELRRQLGSLWALAFLILLGMFLAGLVVRPLLLLPSSASFIGLAIGLFWCDRALGHR